MAIDDQVDLAAMSPEQLLARALEETGIEQMRAWAALLSRGGGAWSGATVIDDACGVAMTTSQMFKHARRHDSPAAVTRRGGRLHTPDNVHFGDRDETAGPAHAFGAGLG